MSCTITCELYKIEFRSKSSVYSSSVSRENRVSSVRLVTCLRAHVSRPQSVQNDVRVTRERTRTQEVTLLIMNIWRRETTRDDRANGRVGFTGIEV